MKPDDPVTITLQRSEWEDVVGGLSRGSDDAAESSVLSDDYEPDELEELKRDATEYDRLARVIEKEVQE